MADRIPEIDARLGPPRTLDTPVTMPRYASRRAWEARAKALRTQILVASGLWPLPERAPLRPRIFGRQERDGYTVEKVLLETLPGLFLGGNLYRPLGKKGPFPGIVSPHGHWARGRIHDDELGSIPARCLNLARLGFVVFAYDMIGYNDTRGLPHTFPGEPLWGVSLQGLQLWDSLRAVDFVAALPDVDARRLGCTGASGGGTQTFLLTAIDERIKASAPVNMISHTMQGGCLCENGPLLRVGTNNLEIGALMAPRPLLMISATGDWTKDTPRVEYPAIRDIYRLYDAESRIAEHQVDAPHNYNRESREHVYAWMVRWLQDRRVGERIPEEPYSREKDEDLLALAPGQRPPGERSPRWLVTAMVRDARSQMERMWPKDAPSLRRFRENMLPAYKACVNAAPPAKEDLLVEPGGEGRVLLGRRGAGDRVEGTLHEPAGNVPGNVLIVAAPDAHGLKGFVGELTGRQQRVLVLHPFPRKPGDATYPDRNFFVTYNRPPAAEQAQDVLTALAFLQEKARPTRLVALGDCALAVLAALPLAERVARAAVDCRDADLDADETYRRFLFLPAFRRFGGLDAALALSAPQPIRLFSARGAFDGARRAYAAAGKQESLRVEAERPAPSELADWLVH